VFKATTNPDIPTLCRAFEQMEARKKLPPLFSREKLDSLFKQVSNNLVFLQCEDERGNVLCFRAVLVLGQHACGYFAATTDYGLKSDASYQILWESILRCKELGVTRFDLGGIDPAANPGGFNFKKGTGARELESLGEWDWATSTWLRLFGNWAIKRRQKAKSMRTEIALPTKLIPLKWVEGPRSFPARLPHSGAK
jgi:lipid II:glycine glycyltransferase (peptidoglycan interpeptide bridge formation enzyme)